MLGLRNKKKKSIMLSYLVACFEYEGSEGSGETLSRGSGETLSRGAGSS